MKKINFTRFIFLLCALLSCIFVALPISSVSASADMGPKPSVRITFENTNDRPCYATLLSQKPSTGPYSVWDGDEEHLRNILIDDKEVWKKFIAYEDEDGFYFLQWAQKMEDNQIAWTYYPPTTFKVLLYYPNQNEFLVSEIYERYAFDSYFTVDVANLQDGKMIASTSYDYTSEIVGLLVRILLTIAIELLLALLFGFREKKQLGLLAGVNTATQVVLNVWLNIVNYKNGWFAFLSTYLSLEFFVLLIEAILYCNFMKKVSEKPKRGWVCVLYALTANVLSFAAGIALASYLPTIF